MKKIILIIALIIFGSTYGQGKLPKVFIPEITSDMLDPAIELGGGTSNLNVAVVTNLSELNAVTSNKIASIQDTIDLATTTVNLPANVVLKFEGGRIDNGTLNSSTNSAIIEARPFDDILGTDVVLTGIKASEIYPEWFGAVGDNNVATDNREELTAAINFAQDNGKLIIGGGNYYCSVDNRTIQSPRGYGSLIVSSNTRIEFENSSYITVIPNVYTDYVLMSIKEADNVTLFSKNLSGGLKGDFINGRTANEGCHLLVTADRCTNITIDGIEIADSSGDGFKNEVFDGYVSNGGGMELGTINRTTGAYEASTTEIRDVTRWDLTYCVFSALKGRDICFTRYNEFHVVGGSYGGFNGVDHGLLDLFFYDSEGAFITVYEDIEMYSRIKFPDNATEMAMVAKQPNIIYDKNGTPTNVEPRIKAQEITVGLTIKNCWIHDSSRNNISITGAQEVYIYNNLIENAKGTLPMAGIDIEDYHTGNKNIVIEKNIFRNNGNYDFVTVESWKVKLINNEFLGQKPSTHLGTIAFATGIDLKAENNYQEFGYSTISPETQWTGNKFRNARLEITGGVFKDAYLFNSKIKTSAQLPTIIENVVMENDSSKVAHTGFTTSVEWGNTSGFTHIKNLKIIGVADSASEVFRGDILIDGLEVENSQVDLWNFKADNVKTNANIRLWGVPADNQHVTFNNWNLTGANAHVQFRAATTNLHHYTFNNLYIETERIATGVYAFDVDYSLGSLTLENSKIIDRGTTGTSWFLINVDNALSKLTINNSKFVTATAGNLIDIGTSSATGFIYKDNILDNVVLNGRTTDIIRTNIINGVEKSQYPVYADNAAALSGGLTAGQEYITSTGVKMIVY